MKYNIILHFGYAEDGSLGFVPFSCDQEFDSPKDAFINLAEFFREAFEKGSAPTLKKCCLLNKEQGYKFCPKCGSPLSKKDFDAERYVDFVKGIGESNTDSYNGDYVEYTGRNRWEPSYDIEVPNHHNIIVWVAEKVLAAAIGHSPHPDRNIDNVFAKEGDRFSFWV